MKEKIIKEQMLCFDDVLIKPCYSSIISRKDCNTNSILMGDILNIPLLSSNMDSVTEHIMANKMYEMGARGVLHRFQTIEKNIEMFKKAPKAWCSFGVGKEEFSRVSQLIKVGCNRFILDIANGASSIAFESYFEVKKWFPNIYITVGNFATSESIKQFIDLCQRRSVSNPNAFKVGIGGGSMCTTRIVTGVGMPTFSSILDCVQTGFPIIADGGIRNSGDYAKAIAVGCKAVMIGGILAGTDETPGEIIEGEYFSHPSMNSPHVLYEGNKQYKKYRGSASKESYEVQGKMAHHRSAEGESTLIPYKGSVIPIIEQLQGGLKSSMSYCDSFDLDEFNQNATFIKVSSNCVIENKPHGKNNA